VELEYLSHPDKRLTTHIANMQEYDIDDEIFSVSVKYHDIGKCSSSFQSYIKQETNRAEPHSMVSALLFLLSQRDNFDTKELLFIYNAILSHHTPLHKKSKIQDILIEQSSKGFKGAIRLYQELVGRDDIKEFWNLEEFDEEILEDIGFDFEDLEMSVADYICQKLLFAKLIFIDKFEAISNRSFEMPKFDYYLKDLEIYKAKKGFNQDSIRSKFSQSLIDRYRKNPSNIISITAPTGIGKTLASLELALYIADSQKKQGIIYAIPYTTIIEQSVEIFQEVFPDREITPHHYKVEYEDSEDNSYDRVKYIITSWAKPFVVSTFYQLLFALFSSKNSDNIKLANMRDRVIVLDEVQAIEFPLWRVLQEMLEPLSAILNTTFILMSATMPIIVKGEYEISPKETLFEGKNRYILKYLHLNSDDRFAELAQKISDIYSSGYSILCVVNSIRSSKLLYKILKDSIDNLFLLNSYMLPKDRERVLDSLREPNSNRVVGKLLISTQVVEAGVDLDFDYGFREFAPFSSIIQSAGRVNREGDKPIATVEIFDKLSYQVYDSTLIEVTHTVIDTHLEVGLQERDILALVEEYFKSVNEQISDREGILDSIKSFDFDAIDSAINKIFETEQDYKSSIVLGVDLKELEERFYEFTKESISKWEAKEYRDRLFKSLSNSMLNIKHIDIKNSGVVFEKSRLFGVYYLPYIDGVYSQDSGFLIKEELEDSSDFFD